MLPGVVPRCAAVSRVLQTHKLWEWSLSRSRLFRAAGAAKEPSGVLGRHSRPVLCYRWCWAHRPTKGETGFEPEGSCELLSGRAAACGGGLPWRFLWQDAPAVKRDAFGRRCVLWQRIDGVQGSCALRTMLVTGTVFKRYAYGIGGGVTGNTVTRRHPGHSLRSDGSGKVCGSCCG